jgi:hypothetical protein
MSGDTEHSAQCEAFADDLAELALGTLAGRRRSDVLEHVGSCRACRVELAQLSSVVESLQQLAPEVQAPLGFERRLAERLQGGAAPRPRQHRRIAVLTAAAVVVGMLAFGLGVLVAPSGGSDKGQTAGSEAAKANFMSQGEVVGDLFVTAGSPGWVFVTVHDGGWQGMVTCDLTFAGGHVETVGVFKLSGEYGAWAAPLPSSAGQVLSAQLIASNGTVVASAQLDA